MEDIKEMAYGNLRFRPETLHTLCQDFIALNMTKTIARYIQTQDLLELKDSVHLPAESLEG